LAQERRSRKLSCANWPKGVLAGFCGGDGTLLFSSNEIDIEVAWFSPQSEYRPTEYLPYWVQFWFSEEDRMRHLQVRTPEHQNKLNPFALCHKLLINALRTAYAEFQQLGRLRNISH